MTSLDSSLPRARLPHGKRVMIVGLWSLEQMDLIKDFLADRDVSARTFNTDESLTLSDVMEGMRVVDSIILVLSSERTHWCNRNSARLSMEATSAGVKFLAIPPCTAVDAAQKAIEL